MYRFSVMRLAFLISTILAATVSSADTIVRLTIEQGLNVNAVDLRLYDADTPLTVSNFMSYVNDGSYNNSFIHRSVSGFIVQGGGYKYDPNISIVADGLSSVITKAAINNEPGISNLRGTIAMAKLDGQPDSATSEWFFNLDDNSAILDPQNGGFTVFGEVINNGMQVIDSISLITIYDMGCIPIFGCIQEIPLLDYISGPVLISTLVKITKVEGLVKISPDYDFGAAIPNSVLQSEFIIENISQQNILVGDIGTNDPVISPFGIVDTQCHNTTLIPGSSCVFVVAFNPVVVNTFSDSFNIELPDLGFDYTVNVSGEGIISISEYDSEKDGVSDLIENAGPNNGDGNYDGILDSTQSNVVSVPDKNGMYLTLTGLSDITYRNVRFVDRTAIPDTPENVGTNTGVLEFTISNLQPDANVQIGMILPVSFMPRSFYIYGPADNTAQSSWFEFTPDVNTGTGAVIVTGAAFVTGERGTIVTLNLQNATRGDSDFNSDNEIKVVGAFSGTESAGSSGQMQPIVLLLLFLLLVTSRLRFMNR